MNALDILRERGFIAQVTYEDDLYKAFDDGMVTVELGSLETKGQYTMTHIDSDLAKRVKDGDSNEYSFSKTEDGYYVARTDTDNMFYTEVFTITIPLEKDISFQDWSDPANLAGPVKKGYDELLDLLLEDTNFSPYNTKVTFDENGKLVEFLYTYSPWN